jgi:hypothetical protein
VIVTAEAVTYRSCCITGKQTTANAITNADSPFDFAQGNDNKKSKSNSKNLLTAYR